MQILESPPSIAARALARINRFFHRPDRPLYFDSEAYQQWLEKNGRELYEQFYSRYTDFGGKRILDLACGYGGKLSMYGKQNPEFVCGVDINVSVIKEAKTYSAKLPGLAGFAGADADALPFADSTFDLVISDDGFDHFFHTEQVIKEIARVLKPGGIAFLSFVPYYSTECSHMTEYLRVPWHHVFFSKKAIRGALELVADYELKESADGSAYRSSTDGVFNVFENHLSRLSLRGFKRALRNIDGLHLVRLRKQSKDWARPFTYVSVLNELFTDAVYCVVRKDGASKINPLAFIRQTVLDVKQDFRAIARRGRRAMESR
ncbi:MAG: class I SAM-dependent methyltransferase [Blastocatellia bacterium]|nr:class I SAM-dependent methyltransferase [Blastocatellia bacterium]